MNQTNIFPSAWSIAHPKIRHDLCTDPIFAQCNSIESMQSDSRKQFELIAAASDFDENSLKNEIRISRGGERVGWWKRRREREYSTGILQIGIEPKYNIYIYTFLKKRKLRLKVKNVEPAQAYVLEMSVNVDQLRWRRQNSKSIVKKGGRRCAGSVAAVA